MDYKVLEIKEDVLKENSINAKDVREKLNENHQLMINVMSSPGSGKTTTLKRIIGQLKDQINIAVMECDIDATVDAQSIIEAGAKAIQVHTGGMCHMDAQMTQMSLDEMGIKDIDLIFIENIGNLVCPAEFDTGAQYNMTILSVPEGDDKPAKYPLVYQVSDLVVVNKIDTLPVFDFNKERFEKRIHQLNPNAQIIYVSSKSGEGFKALIEWLLEALESAGHHE